MPALARFVVALIGMAAIAGAAHAKNVLGQVVVDFDAVAGPAQDIRAANDGREVEYDQIYRVTAKPVAGPVSAPETALKLLIGATCSSYSAL